MADTFTFTIKPIADLSDIKANVNEIQRAFKGLKLPDKITGKLDSELAKFDKAYATVQKKMTEGIKNSSDLTQVQKSNNMMVSSWNEISKIIREVSGMDLSGVLKFDTQNIQEARKQLADLEKQLNSINLSEKQNNQLQKAIENVQAQTKSTKVQDLTQGMLDGLKEKNFTQVFDNYNKLKQHHAEFINMFGSKTTTAINQLGTTLTNTTGSTGDLTQKIGEARQEVERLEQAEQNEAKIQLENKAKAWEDAGAAVREYTDGVEDAGKAGIEFNKTVSQLEGQVESYFGLNAIFRTIANMAREAMNTVKELDAAMTETAVVTNFSVGDMWEKLPLYTAEANKLGSSIKDVYEATTLYYQQGLNTTQSMGLAVETLKMARIAGMDAKEATDAMTAALRGFNLELNQASAQRINDVYSELAAITASDTQEISTAMEKVASLAHNAGMELETTSAFLAQMIETTREAPENLGTALKTVVARFQEMKQDPTKLIDSEGVMLDANKVDKALKSIGVNLMNANGEFRKLDDVFLEIAAKWDTLSMGQQRYIATMAAGSRQQSRFIAMMSNYGRTMELVDAAYDSSGASQRQFEKTLESMEAKLNQLKNAYDQFIMGLMNQEFLKGAVDLGTELLGLINKVIDGISSWTGPLKGTTKMILTLISTIGGLTAAKGLLKGGIGLGVQWFGGKEARSNFNKLIGVDENTQFTVIPKIDKNAWASEKQKVVEDKPITVPVRTIRPSKEEARWASFTNDKDFLPGTEEMDNKFAHFSIGAQKAGQSLQTFGSLLQNTPLAPFGKLVSIVGMGLQSFGGIAAKTATIYSAGAASATTATGAMAGGFKALGIAIKDALAPFAPFLIAAAAVVAIGVLLYREFTKDKREMEALAEAAKASSDAFDNLKTSTETLKNSIEEIRNSDSLFDGLVVGTTEWNLALVEANQQILDLIKKYPMLQKYMTTDANGRMSISEAGFKAVQDEQNKLLGQAQALDIYNNALHNAALERQEQDKLLKDEGITKTKAKTIKHGRDHYTITEEQANEINYNALSDEGKKEWEGIEARIKAESEAANKQAIRAALSTSGELNDTVLNLFGQNFEDAQKAFKGETDMSVMKQAYADFIGGVFDSATGTITDLSGEEVDIDKEAIQKMYPQIMALLQFQEQAPQVESAVKSLGKSFDSVFGNKEGNTFINDLLNNNLEADASAINKFLDMSDTEIGEVLENISDEEVKAIMQSDTAQKSDLINLLKTNADNLKQAQTQSYKDATVWYAKAVKKWGSVTAKVGAAPLASAITKGLTIGSADAINNFMNQMSQSLDSASLSTVGESLFGALLGQSDDIQQELVGIINNVDWSSAIERGKFYEEFAEDSEAFEKLNADGQKFVKTTKQVDKGLDLTGKQFEELVQSSDFLEILTDKWSDFADESGKVDATGIREMAKECGTLSKVLNLAEFDADNLAMALNYFQQTGSFDGITGAVIAAAKEFNSLDKLIDDVKQDVEGFKPGENYDQGMDAYRGYMKSLKEGYENRQYSDADTLSYAHRFVNSSEWKDYARAHGGSNKSAEKEIIDSLETIFTENEEDTTINILNRLASGKTLLGGQAKESDVFSAYYNEEGQLKLDIDPTTTRDAFIKALVEERGFTEEMARAFTLSLEGQDWGFIDDNLTDAFNKAGRDSGIAEYIQGIRERGLISSSGQSAQGNTVISQAELEAIQSMGGYETLDEVVNDIATSLGVLPETIKYFNTETQNAVDFLKLKFGESANIQDSAQEFLKVKDGVGDFNQATTQLQQSGIDATTALELAVQMAQEAGIEQVRWGEDLVNVSDVINGDQFNEAVEKLNEDQHWQDVGKILGDAVATALAEAGIGNGPQNDDTDNTEGSNSSSDFTIPDIKAEIMSQFSADKIQSQLDEATKGITANFEAGLEVDKQGAFEEISEVKQEAEKQVIMPVDADTKNAVTKDGILVSQIEQEVTKQVNADTAPAQTAVNELDQRASQPVFKTIHATITGLTAKIKEILGLAKGQNNYISPSGFYTGSAARGVKGTLGPNGKGGLTLTGEEGFEIAWLPSEGRAMILGAAGPQMTNLPSDAVVYTHEQSKKIVKQKGISTGSAYGGTYDSPRNAINVNIVGNQTSGSGSGSGSSSSSSSEKDPKRTNWYKEEITRYNLNQSINQITAQIEKITKSIEKSLDKLGTKYSDIAKDVDTQAKLINQNISNQKALQKSYQDQINLLTNGGRSLWIDITDSAGDSSQKSISTSQFISKQSDGSYYVNRDKVMSYAAGLGGDYELQKVNAESIFNTIQSELSNLTSGLLNAEKAVRDGEEEFQNLLRQVADAFYAWENELTKVYELTQLIEVADGRRGRLAAETSLLLAQVSAGYSGVSDAAERLRQIQRDDAVLIKEQINLRQNEIEERRKELGLIASSADEWKHYQEVVSANSSKAKTGSLTTGDQAKEQAAWDKYIAAALAESYVKQTYNQDGTINLELNTTKLEEDRLAGNITEKTYEAIKEGYDKMVEAEEALNESVTSGFELLTDLYEQFNGHIKTMADLENDLIKAFEDTARMEVSKLEALNSSLTTAAKSVLDQVKKNLDARRKAEDNAKTESDIAKKQQRLNALRANTSGGNAVEIAQLEKEIGDSQKSYGRTLEDQMLSQMQTQADEASKQRQEQIDLAKQQIEYNKQAGVYAEMADYLLADIDDEQDKIQATLLSTQELNRGRWQQLIDELEIKNQVAEAINASEGLIQLAKVLGIEIDEKTGEIKGGLESIAKALSEKLTEYNQNMMKVNEKASGDRLAQNDQGITSINTKQPSITQNAAPKTSSSSSSSKSSSTPKAKDYSSGWLATLPETNSNYFSASQVQTLQHGLNTMKWSGLISFGADLAIDGIIGPKTTTAIKALQKLVGTTQDGIWGPQTGSATHKKYPKYARGGLANKTGPAWLDGTPTKPELVLNAQDTKNFIALKDILSGVMRSISHTDTSNIYNSPTNFEINVNVDKISSDYDVDKLTERIKRNIVKDATYRNVTAVRNFR